MNFYQALFAYFKNYFNFNGRASRSEFFYPTIFNIIISLFMVIFFPYGTDQTIPKIIRYFLFVPNISNSVRRFHDTNHSGWWYFAIFVNLGLFFEKGDNGCNKYGENPLDKI